LGEETTVDVEITDGAGNYSNNAELRWNVDIPAPAQKVEYHIYRDPANNSPTKHGTYESFYEDGSFYETGTYTNGHKDGFWTGFYPNGTTRYKYCWKVKSDGSAGVLHGPSIDYNKDGSIRSEYQYSDGNKHGEFVEYHSTGTFHLKGSYKGDNRDGLWEEWADDGTKKKEYNFSEGIKEGQYKEYDNSGNLVIEGEYKEGRNWNGEFFVHVEWQEYDDNEDESEFAGYWTALVESGKEGVPGRFTYSEGVWNGNAIIYDEDGNIASEENYVAGALEGPTVVYDEDGNVTWHVEYKAGKVDGKITRFSDDGTKVSEYSYSEGIRNGEFVQYHTNGTVRLKGSYKENVWDGLREEWAEDGTKISEYNYSEGIHDGQRSYYDEDGVVLYEEVYDLGTLVESPLTGRWSSDTGSITINIDISGIASGTMSNLSSNMNELRILFDSFYTEEHFDYFSANYRSKRLKRWSGGPITSWWTDWVSLDTGFFEGGSLEFLFDSDGSLTYPGFYITMLEFRNASGETESLTVEITDGAGNYSNDQYLEWYVAIPDFPSRINSTTWSWEVLPRAIYPGRQSVSLILDGSNPVIYVIEAISPAELVLRSEDGEQVILRKID